MIMVGPPMPVEGDNKVTGAKISAISSTCAFTRELAQIVPYVVSIFSNGYLGNKTLDVLDVNRLIRPLQHLSL